MSGNYGSSGELLLRSDSPLLPSFLPKLFKLGTVCNREKNPKVVQGQETIFKSCESTNNVLTPTTSLVMIHLNIPLPVVG